MNQALWDAVLELSFEVEDAKDGYLWLSWDNATVFCRALTRHEHEARRLPADYEYALPTRRQLRQMRDGDGRLPGPRGMWLWTAETNG